MAAAQAAERLRRNPASVACGDPGGVGREEAPSLASLGLECVWTGLW